MMRDPESLMSNLREAGTGRCFSADQRALLPTRTERWRQLECFGANLNLVDGEE
jgi:hypothetical protein